MNLFVSDLDGTLLNSNQRLSDFTVETINSLLDKGLNFTVATARSYDSAWDIISPLKLKLPIILSNGVFIYDLSLKKRILSNYLDDFIFKDVMKVLIDYNLSPIISAIGSDMSHIYYKGIFNYGEKVYISDGLKRGDKRFKLIDDYEICKDKKIVTIICIAEESTLEPIYSYLKNKYELEYHFMKDIYSGYHWLEITSKNANKKEAVKYLKSYLNADKVTCFGDNLNDCTMFEICDDKYAVMNAHPVLKQMATKVIGGNNEDGVARFLKNNYALSAASIQQKAI